MRGEWLSSKAVGQVEEEVTLQGKRGTIYDAQHQPMAVSLETPSVAAYPAVIQDKAGAASRLAKVLHLKRRNVLAKLKSGKRFVWLKRQASPKEADAVRALTAMASKGWSSTMTGN